ncbi:MAG: selenocysteine-specific translation elongation factor [Rhodospirillales bacterium]
MIIATAGHIDHGKTLLVKALTGIDTDRLPDEKRRGLTIDIGFAYKAFGDDETLGFVDVPGHERFVRNMLAGVTNIDFVLFVVAADDGIMPQTVEHLDILNLLNVRNGAIAITKSDRVDQARLDEVDVQISGLLSGTALENAPSFRVSALTGDGIDVLYRHLHDVAHHLERRRTHGNFRLAVDRCFTLSGSGLVVTGSVFSGTVQTGDQIIVAPAGIPARVRSLHAQNRESERGSAGQRCALNLTGRDLKKSAVQRGSWIVAEPAFVPTDRIDVKVRALIREPRPLRHWMPVHVHVGAADLPGRLAILESRAIEPGDTGIAQLVLDDKTNVFYGDRFILRDQSARRTIGGGWVLDPFAPKRGRAKPERLLQLVALDQDNPTLALSELAESSPNGIDLTQFARARNLTESEYTALRDSGSITVLTAGTQRFALAPRLWDRLQTELLDTLKKWHGERPESPGLTVVQVTQRLSLRLIDGLLGAAVERLIDDKSLTRRSELIGLAGHRPSIPPQEAALWKRVKPLLDKAGLRPPTVRELAADLGMRPDQLQRFLDRSVRRGVVQPVAKNRYFTPDALHRLGAIAEQLATDSPDGLFNAAAFRDRSGIGRNLTIELLEYFDTVKLTKRQGDLRGILRPADEVFRPLTDD